MPLSMPGMPDTITHEEIDFETFTIEELDDQTPCDVEESGCQSHHALPATWLGSHEDADPGCTVLMCEPCVMHLQEWIAHCVVHHGMYGFGCKLCGRGNMKYTKIITRKM